MSLRVRKSSNDPVAMAGTANEDDPYESRVAKLIPAEALALFGTGSAIIPGMGASTWILAGACLLLAIIVRWKATQSKTGQPQWAAIVIAAVSFTLWVFSLEPPVGLNVFHGTAQEYVPALAAIIWAAFVPVFYKGDED